MATIDQLKKERLKKLENLRKLGIDPYPAKLDSGQARMIVNKARKLMDKKVSVAGRLRSLRPHGKITFADLEDESGRIQLFFSEEILSSQDSGQARMTMLDYDLLPNLDIGDFLEASGEVFKTQAGEISVRVSEFKLLTKSIRPLPSEFYGLKDEEARLRKRYLDLLANPETRELFVKKAKFWTAVRDFLIKEGFIEVETPALEPIPGGADARPFITEHNVLKRKLYLRISLELYQKRLLVGGFEKVFEIGKIFRNEGLDKEHLQDYLQMEFYWAYTDYNDLMELTQRMYQYVVKETVGSLKTIYQGNEIDWSGDWEKVDYVEAFKKETGIDLDKDITEKELEDYAKKNNIPYEGVEDKGRLIDSIYKRTVRPKLIQPCFLINHSVDVSPLAKRMKDDPNRVERMQILVGGTEAGNGWSELNDPIDQRERFEEQEKLRNEGDEEAQMMDTDFVEALEYGMPPAAGFGFSQRLFAVIVDKPIRETVFFPPMREE